MLELEILQEDNDFENKDIKLMDYAYCGSKEDFLAKMDFLEKFAEPEVWSLDGKPSSILIKYFNTIFKLCHKQNKIKVSLDGKNACFNTGLLTPHGHDIMAFFAQNLNLTATEKWFFKGFKDKSDKYFMNMFNGVPELVSFTNNFNDYFFDPYMNIEINYNHILEENWPKIKDIVKFDKTVIKTLFYGVVEETKQKIKRNWRLVIPQFYRNEIMFLLPIEIPTGSDTKAILALAVQKTDTKQYRANTIFTLDVAYEKARIIMKPDSWLSERNLKK